MRIDELRLMKFGHLTDERLDFSGGDSADGRRPLEIVYGPNESGKSTRLRAITQWLFGFPHKTNDDFLHPSKALRVGGRISDDGGDSLEAFQVGLFA